jgi:glycoside/pentoside/hexuronide:cation symporter, GPH family
VSGAASAQKPLPVSRLLAYGALGLPYSLAGLPILVYLPAFYTQELKLSAGLVGAVFLSARLWDGFADVFIGWLSDRTRSRFGRRKPWVMVGAPLLMISTWFLCNPPPTVGLVYLGVWAALFYTAAAVVGIPYVSWGTELTGEYAERNRVTAFREAFGMMGSLVFASMPLIFLAESPPLQQVLLLVSLTLLVLVPLTALPLGLVVPDPPQTSAHHGELLQGLAALAKDRVFVRFMLAALCLWVSNGVSYSLMVFGIEVGLGLPGDTVFLSMLISCSAVLCTLQLTIRLGRHLEKHRLLAGALMVLALTQGALLFAPAGNLSYVVAVWAILGVTAVPFVVLPTSMLADVIDHGEVQSGARRPGAYVAIFNLIFKIGLALGVGLSFGLLDWVDYDPSAAVHSDTDVRNIRLLAFGLPGLFFVLSAMLFLAHPITKQVQQRLRAQIESRRDPLTSADPAL